MERILVLLLLWPLLAGAQVPPAAWQYRNEMVHSAWRIHGPDAPVAMLAAQIEQESAWRVGAVSWAGAQGLAQFMPGTATDAARRWPNDCQPANPFSPTWAFACRDRYLRSLQVTSQGGGLSECDELAFKFRAYNGGATWARRDRALAASNGTDPDDWKSVGPFNSGRSPSAFRENTDYPVRIFRLEPKYREWGRMMGCGDE